MSLALEAKRIEYATLPDGSEGGGRRLDSNVPESSAVSQKPTETAGRTGPHQQDNTDNIR